MTYLVSARAGDTLCSIARTHGYSNCGTLRSHPANAAFLDAPLQVNDQITIPAFRDTWVYSKIATGRRWTVRGKWPVVAPQPATISLIRKQGANTTAVTVPAAIGISRFVPQSVEITGGPGWCDENQRDFDAQSARDPCTFSIEVNDPGATGTTVPVYLEALQPLYAGALVIGHQRFAAGATRDRRTLWVTAEHLARLPAGRFWSSELRLVSWEEDKDMRPHQTLLVTDLFDASGGGPDIQILDQRVRAVYEDSECPNAAGTRCIKAWHSVPLPRGRSVALDGFILRNPQTGQPLVSVAEFTARVQVNCRRIYAQEELSFVINSLQIIDPPSDMLTVAERTEHHLPGPTGRNAAGTSADITRQGRVGFTLTQHPANGAPTAQVIGPILIPANNTPMQTALLLVAAINQPPIGQQQVFTATASQNFAEHGEAQGSVDISIVAQNGTARITQLTPAKDQDKAQPVECIQFNVAKVPDEQPASILRKGGYPMRRQLFKSRLLNHQHISIFVVNQTRGGLTTMTLQDLVGRGVGIDASVHNCITMNATEMNARLDLSYTILPHELGHALTDVDHVPMDADNQSLMHANMVEDRGWENTRRISAQVANVGHVYEVVGDNTLRLALNAAWLPHAPVPGPGEIGTMIHTTTMHDLIAANTSLLFTPR